LYSFVRYLGKQTNGLESTDAHESVVSVSEGEGIEGVIQVIPVLRIEFAV
jgi:hypothetical protein